MADEGADGVVEEQYVPVLRLGYRGKGGMVPFLASGEHLLDLGVAPETDYLLHLLNEIRT